MNAAARGSAGLAIAWTHVAVLWKAGPLADTLDQDVQALKDWLRSAWRSLASPSITLFERREIRNYMKEADAALRSGLQKVAARERARKEAFDKYPWTQSPDFRILKIET
jgi:hypothetical protein